MAIESQRSGERGITRRESETSRYRPFSSGALMLRPFALLREMTELMDQAIGGDLPIRGGERVWAPAVEVRQRDNKIVVDADLPGIDPSDVKVEIDNDALEIQGERKRETTEHGDGWQRSERSYGAFYRLIPLPEGAKSEQAKAEFKNGVLEVTVPISETATHRRQIPVSASGSQQSQQQPVSSAQQFSSGSKTSR